MARRARPGGRAVSRPGPAPLAARRCGVRPAGRVRVPGSRGLPVRDPSPREPGTPRTNRAAAHATRGTAAALCPRFNASFRYRAQSWNRERRVVAKVEWHPGELYPRVGFIVTNLQRPAKKGGRLLQWARDGGAVDQG